MSALVDHNRVWLQSNPTALALKYQRMSADPYDLMRGSAGVYFDDIARPSADRPLTSFLTVPGASEVMLTGDPHPENFGTLGDESVLSMEVVDLDGAAFGPYLLDLRRLVVGLSYIANEGGCDCASQAVRSAVLAYAVALRGPRSSSSSLASDLFAASSADGLAQSVLSEATYMADDHRRVREDVSLDADGRGVLPLTTEESAQLDRLLAGYSPRLLSAARRYGAGVASVPAVRYALLVDDGDPSPDDDRLLSLREVIDPPQLAGASPGASALWASAADRVTGSANTLWSRPLADPQYLALTDGQLTFKVQSWSGWAATFNHAKLIEGLQSGQLSLNDYQAWAADLGAILGATHARGRTALGHPAATVILNDIDGREQILADELAQSATADVVQLRADQAALTHALRELGPLLGADLMADL